ncbi:hypothetical protein L13192_02544 [Pyrenophora tritici-repentis]|uniref:Uncharacterized protein n=1 Tax=Pyrenophora tritici-repentis TaxID=45151 RepID=A0A922NPK5_9PLEO|nr:hypothetical protein Ptr86124_000184 [Pyrenophora tritici-repentis]KAI1675797.1 hypothetical protein L13192_02544 [Pyrenophora tritici-repentis]KAI1687033.1 hypothetical protein KJE20_00210 [Pyrenophora tritici-repentis]
MLVFEITSGWEADSGSSSGQFGSWNRALGPEASAWYRASKPSTTAGNRDAFSTLWSTAD